jgi:N-acetylmuramoyl-L-alanine amidase
MEKHRRQFLKQIAGMTGLAGVCALPAIAQAASPVRVNDIRLSDQLGYVRLVFDLDGVAEYSIFSLHNPERVILDLKNASMTHGMVDRVQANSLIRGVRSGVRNSNDLRVVFDLADNVTPRSFMLAPAADASHRLVLDLHSLEIKQQAVAAQPQLRNVIIAIDAGHGGKDPGATGRGGTREKNITLQIAQKLAKIVNQQPGMTAVLTRSTDRFLRLRDRIAKARENSADMMISLHADSFPDPRATGSSVYALSVDGASDETARLLAENENAVDLLFGDVSLAVDDAMVKEVLFDLSLTGTIESSLDIGNEVLQQISSVNRVHRKRVQQAEFAVLKAPNIPSVLIETAFISNPREEKNLKSPAHQNKVANAIARGINSYFSRKAPPGTWLSQAMTDYKVRNGDTLSKVAVRFNISETNLRARNALHTNTLSAGQVLKIPVS